MAALTVDIADAIVSHVNDGHFAIGGWTAVRKWIALTERSGIGAGLHVTVVPAAEVLVSHSARASTEYAITTWLFIQRAADYDNNKTIDDLAVLAEEMRERVRTTPQVTSAREFMSTSCIADLKNVVFDPYIDHQDLLDLRIVTSRLAIDFTGFVPKS